MNHATSNWKRDASGPTGKIRSTKEPEQVKRPKETLAEAQLAQKAQAAHRRTRTGIAGLAPSRRAGDGPPREEEPPMLVREAVRCIQEAFGGFQWPVNGDLKLGFKTPDFKVN